ncbi:MAG: ABC transporter ATP-binding protein [Pirellulales bacterium]
MIEVSKLSKSFGSRKAVNAVDLSISRGETFGLLGPNGAGKSTTIGMLVGLVRPDSGEVRIAGGNPSQAEVRRKIGIAPQSLSLYENLSAADNLSFFGTMYGLLGSSLGDRVRWGLEFAGLTDRANDRVVTFSGGMKRRLNIAVGLVHQPEVLLLDEPTVGVDPQSRNHILESIAKLASDGLTIIFTTHYMEEAERLCDRIAIIDHGSILANDRLNGLIQRFGGKSLVTAQIVHRPSEVTKIEGAIEGNQLKFHSDQPVVELAELQQLGVQFGPIRIDQPNLESVFLSLTGRTLRD